MKRFTFLNAHTHIAWLKWLIILALFPCVSFWNCIPNCSSPLVNAWTCEVFVRQFIQRLAATPMASSRAAASEGLLLKYSALFLAFYCLAIVFMVFHFALLHLFELGCHCLCWDFCCCCWAAVALGTKISDKVELVGCSCKRFASYSTCWPVQNTSWGFPKRLLNTPTHLVFETAAANGVSLWNAFPQCRHCSSCCSCFATAMELFSWDKKKATTKVELFMSLVLAKIIGGADWYKKSLSPLLGGTIILPFSIYFVFLCLPVRFVVIAFPIGSWGNSTRYCGYVSSSLPLYVSYYVWAFFVVLFPENTQKCFSFLSAGYWAFRYSQ